MKEKRFGKSIWVCLLIGMLFMGLCGVSAFAEGAEDTTEPVELYSGTQTVGKVEVTNKRRAVLVGSYWGPGDVDAELHVIGSVSLDISEEYSGEDATVVEVNASNGPSRKAVYVSGLVDGTSSKGSFDEFTGVYAYDTSQGSSTFADITGHVYVSSIHGKAQGIRVNSYSQSDITVTKSIVAENYYDWACGVSVGAASGSKATVTVKDYIAAYSTYGDADGVLANTEFSADSAATVKVTKYVEATGKDNGWTYGVRAMNHGGTINIDVGQYIKSSGTGILSALDFSEVALATPAINKISVGSYVQGGQVGLHIASYDIGHDIFVPDSISGGKVGILAAQDLPLPEGDGGDSDDGGDEGGENSDGPQTLITVWKIDLNARSNVAEIEDDDGAPSGTAAVNLEKAINYIVKTQQPSAGGTFTPTDEAGNPLKESHGYLVAHEGDKIYLTPTLSAGYKVSAAYNGETLLQVDENDPAGRYYLIVPKGGAVKLSMELSVLSYTVQFVNYDGTELQSSSVAYGETPVYNGETPTKPADAQYTYTFVGWTPEITSVTDNVIYTATYEGKLKKYTITFVNEDGTELQSSQVEYGKTPAYEGATPTKPADAQYTYTFAGWTPEITPVEGDATYTATYESTLNKYTIKFVNEDGTELQSSEVEYGKTPAYEGATPIKAADAQYTYTFAGWTPKITSVTDNATYTATYDSTLNKYTITFVNEDGTELQSGKVEYGQTPVYNGATPTKAADAQYTYTFAGWTPEITPVEGEATYTATYDGTLNKYTIKFVNEDGTELQSSEVEYGKTPAYEGATPTKAATAQYTYTFAGWTPEIVPVNGDATYTAIFLAEINQYDLTFDLDGGTLNGQTGTVTIRAKYGSTVMLPDAPMKENFRFLYWRGSEYQAGASYLVEGAHAFTAVWEEIPEETTEAPTTEEPTTEEPTTEVPTAEEPTTEVPTAEEPTTEVPTTEEPTTAAPTSAVPTSAASTTASGQEPPVTPDMGDHSGIGVWITLLMSCILLTALFVVRSRKIKENEQNA
ncbi:MAG: hypothetical protein J5496_00525 [Lachnospiraceae bacterium]|nr:hypothetical protein [Lachnospiraceae bacterium]